jgi:hypothetical protein
MNIACNEYKSHKTSNKDFSQNSQEGFKTKHLLIYQALKLKTRMKLTVLLQNELQI